MSDFNKKIEICQWPNCGNISTIIYFDSGLCDKHWYKVCEIGPEKARKKLGIKELPKYEPETTNIISIKGEADEETDLEDV
jgi:hypothetical protein